MSMTSGKELVMHTMLSHVYRHEKRIKREVAMCHVKSWDRAGINVK